MYSSDAGLSFRAVCVSAFLLAAAPCDARFLFPEIEPIPVERLLGNLETDLDRLTDSLASAERIADARRKLARVYALAYARDVMTLDVRHGTNDVFEGIPYRGFLQALSDASESAEGAAGYLQRAIAIYQDIVNSDLYDIRSRLGLAWALEQAGREQEALGNYRIVAAAAWPLELERDSEMMLYVGAQTVFQEAAIAILRYLDADEDAAEIAELESRLATFDEIGRFVTPILVPLAVDDGFDALVDRNAETAFDLDGSGLVRQWGWITPRAAWLVWDPDGSGRIDSGLQLFGSVSFFIFWNNGYEALGMLDDDRDGRLSGVELAGLALWADADGDGFSDPGEVRPVVAHGVTSIATASQEHARGFPFNPAGIEMADGSTRATYDWIVESPAMSTTDRSDSPPPGPR